jgi:hypothetical protein
MKLRSVVLFSLLVVAPLPVMTQSRASAQNQPLTTPEQQELLELSRTKWHWMAERNVDALENLFHAESIFVHMGGNMTREQELGVIRSGSIHYKHAEVLDSSVRFAGSTAIVVSRIRLDAVVGGNEVTNPFTATEVYVREDNQWKLAVLAFSLRRTP